MPITLAIDEDQSFPQLSVDLRMADIEVNVRFIDEKQAFVTVRFDYCGEYRSTHYQCSSEAASAALRIATSFSGEGSEEDFALAEKAMPDHQHMPHARWIP